MKVNTAMPDPDHAAAETGTNARPALTEREAVRHEGTGFLVEARRQVDEVLARLPRSLSEARQAMARELWPDPRPEELQAVCRIAGDTATSGPRFELPRHLLALRLRIENALHTYGRFTELDAERLSALAEELKRLATATVQFERALEATTKPETSISEDRDYLRNVTWHLLPQRERLATAATLAPVLERLHQVLATCTVYSDLPFLTDEETGILARYASGGKEPIRSLDRDGLEAICLRWRIEEDLAAWNALPEAADGDDTTREAVNRRLRIDMATYRALGDRIQGYQDRALTAHREQEANQAGAIRRALFTSFQKLAPVVHGQADPNHPHGASTGSEPSHDDATAAPASPSVFSLDPALEQARERALVQAMAHPGEVIAFLPGKRPGRSRLRGLMGILVLLMLALVAVHLWFPQGPPSRIQVTPSDFAPALPLIEAESAGTMLYARATGTWTGLDTAEKQGRVEELGRLADQRGFDTIHLVAPDGTPAAVWTRTGGVTIKEVTGDPSGPGT